MFKNFSRLGRAIAVGFALVACSPLANKTSVQKTPLASQSQGDCPIEFPNTGYCARITLENPALHQDHDFDMVFWRKDTGQFYIDEDIHPWVQVDVEKKPVCCAGKVIKINQEIQVARANIPSGLDDPGELTSTFHVKQVRFFKKGKWTLQFSLTQGKTLLDEASLSFDIL